MNDFEENSVSKGQESPLWNRDVTYCVIKEKALPD